MVNIWNMAALFILAFLGLIVVVFAIFFLWLAYRYDISLSINTKENTRKEADKEPADEPIS